MTRLQTNLAYACEKLGLEIISPYSLKTRSLPTIHAQAWLPQLGGENGMIIVNKFSELRGLSKELVKSGYGYSVMSEPNVGSEFNLGNYIQVFSDWGWSSSAGTKPNWIEIPKQ